MIFEAQVRNYKGFSQMVSIHNGALLLLSDPSDSLFGVGR
jgi:hypothetical protein